jgi:ADP-heptose:LPS heptosyltransferase
MRRHVLAVRLDSVGDVLVTGPAIRALAAHADRVTLLAGPTGRAAAELLPGVDEVLVFHAPWIDPDPGPVEAGPLDALVAEIRARRVDEAVVFTSFHQSALPTALLLRLAGVRRIAAISEDYPGSLLDVRHRVSDDVHEVERALSLAAAAGFEPAPDDDLRLALTAAVERSTHRDYVVVHPGASVPARAWSPGRNRELVRRLEARGQRVYVTGAPAERELTSFVAGGSPNAVDLGGRTTLAELASVLAGAAAVICGNTGPGHVAAAVGTPVVSLYAPTVPAVRWRPWKIPHVLLGAQDIACAGCRARTCPFPDHPCLAVVGVDDVVRALSELVSRSGDVCAFREAGVNERMVAAAGGTT